MPGDYIWSSAFPLGTVVRSVSGTIGAQTVNMTTYALEGDVYQNATVTQTGGHMWILPAGLKMFVQTSLHTNYFSGFAWGLEMQCSDWATPIAGCNGSLAQENIFYGNMIGRLVIGNNSGASLSIMNVYAYNTIADIAELGAVGSNYFSENGNSAEESVSIYGQIGLCVGSNSSSFFGGYTPTGGGYCANGIGVATSPGGSVVFWNPIAGAPAGAPTTYNGQFHNPWFFFNDDTDGTQLCMNFTPDIPLAFGAGNNECNGGSWALQFFSAYNFWAFRYNGNAGGHPMWFTGGALGGYTGYQAGNLGLIAFPQGLLMNDTEQGGAAPGAERLIDSGLSIPTASFHKHGDIHFNQGATPGGYGGWIATADGASGFKPFGPVANDTAGTQWTLGNYMTLTPVALASLPATCTAGTFAVINNGVASPVYNAAVGSTTGAATDPVFCTNGNVWKYH